MSNCFICDETCRRYEDKQGQPTNKFSCRRCGDYELESDDESDVFKSPKDQVLLSAWVREQNRIGTSPLVTLSVLTRLRSLRSPGLRERANRALCVIANQRPSLEHYSYIDSIARDSELQAVTYSADEQDALILLHILLEDGSLTAFVDPSSRKLEQVRITAKGFMNAEALGVTMSNSPQGFVAMSFDDSLRVAWEDGFRPGITSAGYTPLRIDNKEYLGGISDEMIAEIRKSQFMVADYTLQRNNVYFEAGFALGLGLTVIPTCKKDEAERLHFDIRHLNTLDWSTPEELADRLEKRIRAVIGAGPSIE